MSGARYPLSAAEPTSRRPSGRTVAEVTLDGRHGGRDRRPTTCASRRETLRSRPTSPAAAGNEQLGANLRRGAELVRVRRRRAAAVSTSAAARPLDRRGARRARRRSSPSAAPTHCAALVREARAAYVRRGLHRATVLVAGVDVGNSTTELACARLEPGGEPRVRLVLLRAPSTGAKGSAESAVGVRELLARGRPPRSASPCTRCCWPSIEPVETACVELGRLEELDLARHRRRATGQQHAVGRGRPGAGRLRRLDALGGPPDGPAIAVILDEDFDEAAAALRGGTGTRLASSSERSFAATTPCSSATASTAPCRSSTRWHDAATLPEGALAAIEVAAAGATVTALSDPLRLAALLDLGPARRPAARVTPRGPLPAQRAALVVREAGATAQNDAPSADATVQIVFADGTGEALDAVRRRRCRPGAVVALRRRRRQPRRRARRVLVRRCPSRSRIPAFRRRLARRRALALALLARRGAADLLAALAGVAAGGVVVVCEEWRGRRARRRDHAARRHARRSCSTSAAARSTCTATAARSSCAGAGELVTTICAGAARRDPRDRRARQARARRPGRDAVRAAPRGRQSHLPRRAGAAGRARAAVRAHPRRAACRSAPRSRPRCGASCGDRPSGRCSARNVRRAIEAAGGVPRGELVMLVGGCACDSEVVEEVAAELSRPRRRGRARRRARPARATRSRRRRPRARPRGG